MSVDGNKNALNRPIGEDGKREWSYDIVDPLGWGCRTCIRSTRTIFSYADHLLFFPPPVLVPRRLLRHLVPLHDL